MKLDEWKKMVQAERDEQRKSDAQKVAQIAKATFKK